jgi:dihydrofolate reductase
MAALVYSGLVSLDGCIADSRGNFEWAAPSEEVHAFINDLERPFGTFLLGRRMYDVLQVWETIGGSDEPEVMKDYASIWRAADKIVFSAQLTELTTKRTRIERRFDPNAIRAFIETADRDISIGGAGLAAEAIRAGLVDEFHLLVFPLIVGGGTQFFPRDVDLKLELVDERRFDDGVVFLRYTALRETDRIKSP